MHAPVVAATLRERGYDVIAVTDQDELRGLTDEQLFRWAAAHNRCIVTENVKDFAPLARQVEDSRRHAANLLFTSSRTFPRARRNPGPIVAALGAWLDAAGSGDPPVEDWLPLAPEDT